MKLRLIRSTKIQSLWLLIFGSILLSLGIQYQSNLTLIIALAMVLLLAQLWSGNVRAFVYLLLGVGMPLFPDVGIHLGGRVLNWFDFIFLVFGSWNLFNFFKHDDRPKLDRVILASIFFLSVLLILVMRSQVIIVSFREWISYVVNFFLTYWVIQNISAKDLKPFLIAILGASYLVNLMAVWQKYNGFRFPSVIDGEVSIRLGVPGTFEDSLLLSMYAGFMGILALMGVLRFRGLVRYFCWISLIINLITLNLALSRNGIFILVVSLCTFAFFRFLDWLRSWKEAVKIPILILGFPVLSLSILVILPRDIYHRITSVFYLFSGTSDPVILYNIRSTLGRLENYKAAIKIFLDNPLEGIGLGLYPIMTKFHDADGFYTGLLAETGLIGSASFLIFAISFISFVYLRLKVFSESIKIECYESYGILLFYQLYFSLIIALFLVSLFEPIFKIQIMTFYIFYLLRLLSVESELLHERSLDNGV
ncbi:MAG: O-antigen ligase family protein [bacterium]|nr:O-antigen ligase family protein [bacterium]